MQIYGRNLSVVFILIFMLVLLIYVEQHTPDTKPQDKLSDKVYAQDAATAGIVRQVNSAASVSGSEQDLTQNPNSTPQSRSALPEEELSGTQPISADNRDYIFERENVVFENDTFDSNENTVSSGKALRKPPVIHQGRKVKTTQFGGFYDARLTNTNKPLNTEKE